jgi:hypothetical protein
MGIKFSVGMSDESGDFELLEEVRRHGSACEPLDADSEMRATGWPMSPAEDDEEPGRSLWAW